MITDPAPTALWVFIKTTNHHTYMIVKINDNPEHLPIEVKTVAELLRYKKISTAGTAVAINSHIACGSCWESREICEGDNIMILSATYGG